MIPLSYAQQRLWFLAQLEGPSATYNIPLALRLSGDLDTEALTLALADVVARHESLRTVYPEREGTPYQHILPAEDARPELPVLAADEDTLADVLAAESAHVFGLAADLPVQARLIRLGEREHVLLVVMHHIASDGWSIAPLLRDLAHAYGARRAGHAPQQEPLEIQYADYAHRDHHFRQRPSGPPPVRLRGCPAHRPPPRQHPALRPRRPPRPGRPRRPRRAVHRGRRPCPRVPAPPRPDRRTLRRRPARPGRDAHVPHR
ncbi:hypothetical protein SXANM310S_07048 [Streptomyces xanthochromogenes]